MLFKGWASGRLDHLTHYQPSLGDLFLLFCGYGKEEPIAVIGVPTRS